MRVLHREMEPIYRFFDLDMQQKGAATRPTGPREKIDRSAEALRESHSRPSIPSRKAGGEDCGSNPAGKDALYGIIKMLVFRL
jgi:hypothetical protein